MIVSFNKVLNQKIKKSNPFMVLICMMFLLCTFPTSSFARTKKVTPIPQPSSRSQSASEVHALKPSSPTPSQGDTSLSEALQVPILVYHSVEPATSKKEGVMQKHYHIFPENFEKQMQYLKDHGYSPIPFQQLIRYYEQGGVLPEKPVVITFDDGWKNQYEYAYPILKKFGYPATFFIITKSRGGVYMTWDDIRTLDQAGMDIGSHTETHANLAKESKENILKEVVGSKKTLEKELGHPIQSIAYPYYGNNDLAQEEVREAGYRAARAGWTGKKNSRERLMQLASQEAVNNQNPFSSKADR